MEKLVVTRPGAQAQAEVDRARKGPSGRLAPAARAEGRADHNPAGQDQPARPEVISWKMDSEPTQEAPEAAAAVMLRTPERVGLPCKGPGPEAEAVASILLPEMRATAAHGDRLPQGAGGPEPLAARAAMVETDRTTLLDAVMEVAAEPIKVVTEVWVGVLAEAEAEWDADPLLDWAGRVRVENVACGLGKSSPLNSRQKTGAHAILAAPDP